MQNPQNIQEAAESALEGRMEGDAQQGFWRERATLRNICESG